MIPLRCKLNHHKWHVDSFIFMNQDFKVDRIQGTWKLTLESHCTRCGLRSDQDQSLIDYWKQKGELCLGQ